MTTLADQRIILGVGGGIAAYKAPMIVRALTQAGAQVRVVLTESATQFVAPLALQAVSGNPVGTSLFDPGYEHQIGHIELARWADAVIVAPATANLLARMAHGMADDLLTTVLLATTAPVLVCPAMNTQMLGNAAVQANLQTVASHPRTTILDPEDGLLACGEVGSGRLPDADVILEVTGRMLGSGLLRDRRVVVTAGPTREAFDAVLDRIGLPADRVAFFDDLDDNVAGARAAGLQAFRARSVQDVEAALAERLELPGPR